MFSSGSCSSDFLRHRLRPSLVIVGEPNFCSRTTLRPLGPQRNLHGRPPADSLRGESRDGSLRQCTICFAFPIFKLLQDFVRCCLSGSVAGAMGRPLRRTIHLCHRLLDHRLPIYFFPLAVAACLPPRPALPPPLRSGTLAVDLDFCAGEYLPKRMRSPALHVQRERPSVFGHLPVSDQRSLRLLAVFLWLSSGMIISALLGLLLFRFALSEFDHAAV